MVQPSFVRRLCGEHLAPFSGGIRGAGGAKPWGANVATQQLLTGSSKVQKGTNGATFSVVLARFLLLFELCVFVFFLPILASCRKRAEYGFGEYGFKHRAQWVFWPSPSSTERAQWVPLSLLFVCQSELTEFFAELTEFAPKLSEAQWVLFSETCSALETVFRYRFLS